MAPNGNTEKGGTDITWNCDVRPPFSYWLLWMTHRKIYVLAIQFRFHLMPRTICYFHNNSFNITLHFFFVLIHLWVLKMMFRKIQKHLKSTQKYFSMFLHRNRFCKLKVVLHISQIWNYISLWKLQEHSQSPLCNREKGGTDITGGRTSHLAHFKGQLPQYFSLLHNILFVWYHEHTFSDSKIIK